MRIGFNIHAQGVKDTARLMSWCAENKPAWMGVMDGVGLAKAIRQASPDTQVWHRAYPSGGDEAIWKRISPQQWVAQARRELDGTGLWAYCLNEPGFDQDMLRWLCEAIEAAGSQGVKLVVGNFSVGTPEPDQWRSPQAARLLRLLDAHRARVILGLHEYAGGVVTSGFIGGAPNSTQYHRDFIPRENWPDRAEAADMTMWHIGRLKFMIAACKAQGIQPPRVLITEAGFDSLKSDPNPDLRAWLDSLPDSDGFEARAWRGLRQAWAGYYPQWTHEQAYAEQLRYVDDVIYAGLPVEGLQVFCYGHKDAQWAGFDVEGYETLLGALAARPEPITPPPIPTLPPFPADFADRARKATLLPTHGAVPVPVHAWPSAGDLIVTTFVNGAVALVIPTDDLRQDERVPDTVNGITGHWLPVQIGIARGWLFAPLVKMVMALPSEPKSTTLIIRIPGLTAAQAKELAGKVEFVIDTSEG